MTSSIFSENLLDFPDLELFSRPVFEDNRGFFSEIFSPKIMEKISSEKFIQDNFSFSRRGVWRGFHFQENFPQAKLVTVLRGRIIDFALDIRTDSSTFGKIFYCTLSAENRNVLFIPRGFAHGFLTLADAEVFYKVDNIYSPKDESGFAV